MMQLIFMVMSLIFNFVFFNTKHPLAMGLTLLIQTTLICLTSGFLAESFWFSYILFLVFLGGMLVLFIYVTSLASNEMFTFSMKLTMMSIIFFILSMIMLFMLDMNLSTQHSMTLIKPTFDMDSYTTENSLSLNKLYNYPTNLLTILLMNYLLVTLIAVVKITSLFKGPIRQMFN
uniref:NADH-ubiquinone oxidoreductase chain 6 n=1 Tax=Phrosinella nasuta TaxID=2689308 RepID=A0A8A5L587_9MUSC|nr:NADH dehydrogenase subunit 6 [Phrosinella nasuta]QTF74304.1 NADH dehydrogenase subunit 6 [Phrosinella nasuta]